VIECDSIQSTEWYFTYTKNTEENTVSVSELPNVQTGKDNNNIFIDAVKRDNQGEYECTGLNQEYERFFAIATVIVIGIQITIAKVYATTIFYIIINCYRTEVLI